ncbi:MAG TPA: hypothetical protein VK623_08915 [Flavobacterium sp.]|nr:hypothetical protein [Flavobacterium sp.]
MKKEALERYKEAIKDHYDVAKHLENSDYLINPSPAKLRNLCCLLFEQGLNDTDNGIFKNFFGFDGQDKLGQIKKFDIDKFRPIRSFFLRQSGLKDLESTNLAAVLVDYKLRPFIRFKEMELPTEEPTEPVKPPYIVVNTKNEELPNEVVAKSDSESTEENIPLKIEDKNPEPEGKLWLYIITFIMFILLAFAIKKQWFPEKNCMVWKGDHFEAVCCDDKSVEIITGVENIMPRNNEVIENMRRIEVCDTTTFFKNGKAVIWYSKKGGKYEFYTYPGYDPVDRSPLDPITPYMINKHVPKCK